MAAPPDVTKKLNSILAQMYRTYMFYKGLSILSELLVKFHRWDLDLFFFNYISGFQLGFELAYIVLHYKSLCGLGVTVAFNVITTHQYPPLDEVRQISSNFF